MPSPHYDPTNTQPYQAYQPPEVTPPPPAPVEPQGQKPFQFGQGPITKLGAVAGLVDNIMRGYVTGVQQHDAKQVMQAKAKTDNLRASYEQDAQRVWSLAQAGTPKDDPDFVKATQAVQGSWGALQDWIGAHVNKDDGGGKKKSKQKKGDQQAQNPQQQLMADLQSQDPSVKAKAIYQLSQKLGPPVMGQIAQFYTPQAQAQRQTGQLESQHGLARAQAQQTMDQLLQTPQDQWTDKQKQQYESATATLNEGKTEKPVPKGDIQWLADKDGKQRPFEVVDGKLVAVPGAEGMQPPAKEKTERTSPLGSADDYIRRKFGDNPTAAQVAQGTREHASLERKPEGAGGDGSNPIEKRFNRWVGYYKSQGQNDAQAHANAKLKVEGAGGEAATSLAQRAEEKPAQFDSDILDQAMKNLVADPANKDWVDPQTKQLKPEIMSAFANIVGHNDNPGEDDAEWGYRSRADADKPDSNGKYSGGVDKATLAKMEQKLQVQINTILSPGNKKMAALTPDELKAARRRMAPVFGPGSQEASTSSESPRTQGAAAHAPASSPAQGGTLPEAAQKQLKAGHITTFGNGQQWTLDDNGNPKQVK